MQAAYDAVAAEYARRIAGELAHKPFDRDLLDRFADRVGGTGPVADLGSGPGHVTRHLADRGVESFGIDLSPGMVEQARALYPGLRFEVGDLTALAAPPGAWAGAVALYSLIHLPREAIVPALRGVARALRPGAPLLLAFHVGDETRHLEEWWGRSVSIDFQFFGVDEMVGYLRSARLAVETIAEREPYPDVETPTRRAYILAVTTSTLPASPAA